MEGRNARIDRGVSDVHVTPTRPTPVRPFNHSGREESKGLGKLIRVMRIFTDDGEKNGPLRLVGRAE